MIRIVKLTFKSEHREDFIHFITEYRPQISNFKGCGGVKFLNDIANPNIFFTYSHWENEDALNHYRDSELFAKVWGTVKQWFELKAEAWSVEEF